ncbi:MAG: SpoIVB peptidase [Firmicutes bacterium HGW-Firmicutes-14]|nr:MAG: SpoIVB peptidase [Firmicutes bacterium HGW-Firmicutes-14]
MRRKAFGLFLSLLIIVGTLNPQARSFFSLPTNQRVSVGDHIRLELNFSEWLLSQFSVYVNSNSRQVLLLNGTDASGKAFSFLEGWPVATSPGKANIQIRLFGIFPIKNVRVEVLPQTRLVPGGQSVGVLLHSEGVIVVGQSIVEDKQGHRFNPAREAGIEVGDVIMTINGQAVKSDEQVARIINESGKNGKKVKVLVKRNKTTFQTHIQPILCKETGRYRVGLYIRDSAAGVGTLSFYNPKTGKYGALGHVITDSDTNKPIDVSDGKIVRASIQGIQAGQSGQPGEKVGMFISDAGFSGSIEKNTKFGIYGTLKNDLSNPYYREPVPIALPDQVKIGPAEMLTVLDGEKIEKFAVEIIKVLPQSVPDSKGLIVEVTDPRLLKRTGGIIQGMSGSPLLQDGRIVGAVTHVFINDPTRGYGCLIEWMLMESNDAKGLQQKAS